MKENYDKSPVAGDQSPRRSAFSSKQKVSLFEIRRDRRAAHRRCEVRQRALAEAVDAYHLFIQFHPNNDDVPYAMYREAVAHYNQMDTDFFFLPPAHEKDQAEVAKADAMLSEFVERYPGMTAEPAGCGKEAQ